MTIESSSIEKERLALEEAVERFRFRAVSEFWLLKDHLPRSEPMERKGGNDVPVSPAEAWAGARQQHHLARQGLIPWQVDFIAPASPATILRTEEAGPGPSDWFAEPRAA